MFVQIWRSGALVARYLRPGIVISVTLLKNSNCQPRNKFVTAPFTGNIFQMSHYERLHVQSLKTNRRWRTFQSIRVFSLAMTKCLMLREFCPHAHEFYPSSLFSRRLARLEPPSKLLPPPSKPWRPPEEALPRGPPARLPASGYSGVLGLTNKENISEICC